MRRSILAAALAAFTLAGAAACGGGTGTGGPTAAPSAGDTFPVTVGTVTVDHRPTHIVSLAPTLTEMLFAIGAGPQVVAADEYSNYPAQAPKTRLSGFQPNAEAIAKYQPDLVVISNDMDGIVARLSALHIPTYLGSAATTLDDTYREVTDLGRLTGHTGEATALTGQMKDQLAKLVADLPKHRPMTYYLELDDKYYSVTSKTFVGSLFSAAGLTNIADAGNESNAYPQLSAEAIIKANPDFVFLADAECCGQSAATVAARPGWGQLSAVTGNRVVVLNGDIASRWGPRVVDLQRAIVEAVAKAPAN